MGLEWHRAFLEVLLKEPRRKASFSESSGPCSATRSLQGEKLRVLPIGTAPRLSLVTSCLSLTRQACAEMPVAPPPWVSSHREGCHRFLPQSFPLKTGGRATRPTCGPCTLNAQTTSLPGTGRRAAEGAGRGHPVSSLCAAADGRTRLQGQRGARKRPSPACPAEVGAVGPAPEKDHFPPFRVSCKAWAKLATRWLSLWFLLGVSPPGRVGVAR